MSDTILVPVTTVQPDLVTQTDVVVYVPLASKTSPGIVQIGDGLNINNGVVSIGDDIIDKLTADAVRYETVQTLTDDQKSQARQNIDAASLTKANVFSSNVLNTIPGIVTTGILHKNEVTGTYSSIILTDDTKPEILLGNALTHLSLTGKDEHLKYNNLSLVNEQELSEQNENLNNHKFDTNNPHEVTKAQVGLSNVDNTSDRNKPISDATQKALDDKASLTEPNIFGSVLNTIPNISTSSIGLTLNDGGNRQVLSFYGDSEDIEFGNAFSDMVIYGKNEHPKYNYHNIALDTDLDTKMDKSGGIFTGNVGVQGNLSVSGTITTKDTETLKVQDNVIVTNANKIDLLDLSGLAINKNDTQTYGIMYDVVDDSVKLGLGSIDSAGKFTFNEGEGSPVATRSDSSLLTDNHLIKWDATNNKLVDSGCSVDSFVTPDYANKNYVPINTSKSYTMPSPYTVYGNIKNSGSVTMESYTGLHYKPSGQNGSRIMLSPKRSLVHSYYSRAQEDEGYLFDNIGCIECENDSTGATVSIQATKYDDSLGNMNTYGSVIDMTDANLRIGSFSNWKGISSSKNITNAKIDINDNGVQVDVAQGLLTYNDSEVVNMNKLNTTSIRYDIEQTLTDEQKAQARANIGAGTGSGTGGGTTVTVGGVAQDTWDADSKVNKTVDTYSINIDNSGIGLSNLSDTAEIGMVVGSDGISLMRYTDTVDYINLTTDNGVEIHHEDSNVKSDFKVQDVSVMATSEFTDSDAGITYTAQNGIFQGMITIGSATSEQNTLMLLRPDAAEISTPKLTYNGVEVATVNQVSSTSVIELIGTEESPINLSTLEKGKIYTLSGVLYSGANFSSATITPYPVLASVLAKEEGAVYVDFINCNLSTDDSGNITIGPDGTGAFIITDGTGAITIPSNHQLIDESMSDDSTNPVQNKVIKTYIDNLILTTLNTAV